MPIQYFHNIYIPSPSLSSSSSNTNLLLRSPKTSPSNDEEKDRKFLTKFWRDPENTRYNGPTSKKGSSTPGYILNRASFGGYTWEPGKENQGIDLIIVRTNGQTGEQLKEEEQIGVAGVWIVMEEESTSSSPAEDGDGNENAINDVKHEHMTVHLVIHLAPKSRNKGLGGMILDLLLDFTFTSFIIQGSETEDGTQMYLFDVDNIHMVTSDDNEPMVRMMNKWCMKWYEMGLNVKAAEGRAYTPDGVKRVLAIRWSVSREEYFKVVAGVGMRERRYFRSADGGLGTSPLRLYDKEREEREEEEAGYGGYSTYLIIGSLY